MTTCGECKHRMDCGYDGWEVYDTTPSCSGFESPSTPDPIFPNYDYDELSNEAKEVVNALVKKLKEIQNESK